MQKNNKILLSVLFTVVLLLVYLVINVKMIKIGVKEDDVELKIKEPVDIEMKVLTEEEIIKLNNDYETGIEEIIGDYKEIIADAEVENEIPLDKISQLKEEALAYIVTEKYKDTHLKLVLTFSEINQTLSSEKKDLKHAEELVGRAEEIYLSIQNI